MAGGACVAWGACMAGGMHGGGGYVWLGVCVAGGHALQGACMGVYMPGGVHGGGGMYTHTPGRYYGYGIWSMSGRYASYWNAFLFVQYIHLLQDSNT